MLPTRTPRFKVFGPAFAIPVEKTRGAILFERTGENEVSPRAYPYPGPERRASVVPETLVRAPPVATSVQFPPIRMKTRLRPLLAVSILALTSTLSALAADPFYVYSSQTGLADGWKPQAWSGPSIDEVPIASSGSTQLRVDAKTGSQPFAGVILAGASGSCLNLTDKLRQSGVVTIQFKPGKNAQGEPAAVDQPVQVALSFLRTDGQTVHAPFKDQATISPAPEGTKVTFTVANAIKNAKVPPEQLASISSVRVQFVGQPVVGFNIVECSIKAE